MIQDLLSQLGLSTKESAVYMAVLQQGKVTPAQVARLTKINRTTVYSVAKELIEKGLITEDLGNENAFLIARPPADIKNAIKKEQKVLEEKEVIANRLIPELQQLSKETNFFIPKITFISEPNLEQYLYDNAAKWKLSTTKYDSITWGFQDQGFTKQYQAWINWLGHELEPKLGGVDQVHLITNDSEVEKAIAEKNEFAHRVIKFWDRSNAFTSSVWVTGDYVIMVVTNTKPQYLVEIYDETLSYNMREYFKAMWEKID